MQHILLTVSGVTKEAIVECLDLIRKRNPVEYPCHIEVLTTRSGVADIERDLLGATSPLVRLCQDHNLPVIQCDNKNILIPLIADNLPLIDIREERGQEIMTGFIAQRVHDLCSNHELAIHALLLGRCNILSYVLGYSMRLFDRQQDRICHVQFKTNTDDNLHLAHEHIDFNHALDLHNDGNVLPQNVACVTLDFERMSIWCGDTEVRLPPDCFAFYSWLAQHSKENNDEGRGIEAPRVNAKTSEFDGRMRAYLLAAVHPTRAMRNVNDLEQLLEAADDAVSNAYPGEGRKLLKYNVCNEYLVNSKSRKEDGTGLLRERHKNLWHRLLGKTNRTLIEILGDNQARDYLIQEVGAERAIGNHGRNRYKFQGIILHPDQILIRDLPQ